MMARSKSNENVKARKVPATIMNESDQFFQAFESKFCGRFVFVIKQSVKHLFSSSFRTNADLSILKSEIHNIGKNS